jgi:eukaryotic-like serine/threonine-protein kinase
VPDADRWAIVERIYHEAVELPVAQRGAFLESACDGDHVLRHELESLLANDGLSTLDRSALDVAARAVAHDLTPSWEGQTIRSYEILALLGAGGMGEVYRARDRSLGREVALKFLSREVSRDPKRLKRLEREARMLAALNHPRIATLHGLEEHEGQRFLVMELVPGETLAERLRRGALAVREAIDVCRQIAEGLEAAHEAGIVHRDLKPANIKIAPDGRVKLLDFGLAMALVAPESGIEPPLPPSELTTEGAVVGTPAYMSPEQARGQLVDRRTDIWAFGCCVYECFTGLKAFTGNTVTDTLTAVLEKEPDWSALSDGVPSGVRRLLRRSLAKDVRMRLQHIGDARLELEEKETDSNERSAPRRWSSRDMPVLFGAVLIAVAAGVGSWFAGRRAAAVTEHVVTRLTVRLDGGIAGNLTLPLATFYTPFTLSPDGERLVFRARGGGGSQLFVRDLSAFEPRPLPGTQGAVRPFFSFDGHWVGFWRAEDRILRKVSLAGGSPLEIGSTDVPHFALWGANDEILIETGFPNGRQWTIPASGGRVKPLALRDRREGDRILAVSSRVPGGSDLLVASSGADGTWLDLLSPETGTRRRLLRGGGNIPARFTPSGHLVYADADALFAVPVNQRFEPVGDPAPVLQGIDHYFRHSNVALSDNGTVVYVPADHVREAELVWLNRDGDTTPVTGGRAPFVSFALSPDGREAAGALVQGTKLQVWLFDLERGAKRLLVAEGESREPIWSRDGAFITYVSDIGDEQAFCRTRADGTGTVEVLMRRSGYSRLEDWSPDGRSLLFSEYTSRGDSDVWIYSGGKATPLIASPFNEESPRFSPDGRFIAFDADDGGVAHVYVQPFPGKGPRTAISAEESSFPEWINEGRQLFYMSAGQMNVVDVQTQPVVRIGQARALNNRRGAGGGKPSPDGRRFLTLSPRAMEGPPELRIILNWFEELERLAPHPHR